MGWFVKMLRDRGRAELYFPWEVEGNLNVLALLATVGVDPIMLGVFLVARGEIRLSSLDSYIQNVLPIFFMYLFLACGLYIKL